MDLERERWETKVTEKEQRVHRDKQWVTEGSQNIDRDRERKRESLQERKYIYEQCCCLLKEQIDCDVRSPIVRQ